MAQPKIVYYGAEWCAPCVHLRKYMDMSGIEYDYKDVDEPDNEKEMLRATDGTYLIPTLIINEQAYQNPSPRRVKELISV